MRTLLIVILVIILLYLYFYLSKGGINFYSRRKACNLLKKSDYFNYGGGSEFFGHSLEVQEKRIRSGLEKFKREKINIRSFFAPNQTYDENTFKALKESGIFKVIDGYGLMPYTINDIKFVPQLFYKLYFLPFGIQSTQIHINYWDDKDFKLFENFIKKNNKNIIDTNFAFSKNSNHLSSKIVNQLLKNILKFKRFFF